MESLDELQQALERNDLDAAYAWLERAHILGQRMPLRHAWSHWLMLRAGWQVRLVNHRDHLADRPMATRENLHRAAKTLAHGCPLTAHLVWEQIRRARHLSLAEVFRMEYAMSLNCCRHPEFPEGVRARLIDKDHQPRWHWPDVAHVPPAAIEAHFLPAWDGSHPLADL